MSVASSHSFAQTDVASEATPTGLSTDAGDEPAARLAEATVPEILVVGRRGPSKAFSMPRSVAIIDAKTLAESSAQSAAELAGNVRGVSPQTTNRGAGAPILRGLIGTQNVVTINGLRFNNSAWRTGPNQYLGLFDPWLLGRMEVLLGPGAVLYGTDAMGGVIDLQLPTLPERGFAASAFGRYATADNSWGSGVRAGYTGETLAVQLGGAWRDFGALTTGGGGVASASHYGQRSLHAQARWQPDATWTVTAAALRNQLDGAGRTDELGRGTVRTADNRDDFAYLDIRRSGTETLRELRLAAYVHAMSETNGIVKCTLGADKAVPDRLACARDAHSVGATAVGLPATITSQDVTEDRVLTLGGVISGRWSLLDGRVTLRSGVDWATDAIDATKQSRKNSGSGAYTQAVRGNFSSGSSYLQAGIFGLTDITLLRHGATVLELEAGGRLAHIRAAAPGVPVVGDVRYAFTGATGTLGLSWRKDDAWLVYIDASQGFRAPNLQETTVLGDTGNDVEVPNGTLRPERSLAVELGGRLQHRGASLDIAGFVNSLEDLIDRTNLVPADYAAHGIDAADLGCTALGDAKCKKVAQRVNRSSGRFLGVDLAATSPQLWGARAWMRMSAVQGDVSDGTTSQPARRVPPVNGAIAIRWSDSSGRLYIEPQLRFAAAQDRLNSADKTDLRMCEDPSKPGTPLGDKCTGAPAWRTVGVKVGYQWVPKLAVARSVRVDLDAFNLGDGLYRTYGSGVDAPGRGAMVTVGLGW